MKQEDLDKYWRRWQTLTTEEKKIFLHSYTWSSHLCDHCINSIGPWRPGVPSERRCSQCIKLHPYTTLENVSFFLLKHCPCDYHKKNHTNINPIEVLEYCLDLDGWFTA